MPRVYYARIEVPSNSRTERLFTWLNNLLGPHHMKITNLTAEDGASSVIAPDAPMVNIKGEPLAQGD